jgi:hypothetical protein
MVEMSCLNSPLLAEAVRIWSGWGACMMPDRDDNRLVARLGNEAAVKLLPIIKELEQEFYASDARLMAADLQEMEKLASEDFKKKYPGISEDIVRALAWCYTFDFK